MMRKPIDNQIITLPVTLTLKRDILEFIDKELRTSDLNGTMSAVITASMQMLMRNKTGTVLSEGE